MTWDRPRLGIAMSETEVFNAAVKLPPAERPAFLDRACGTNHKLRDEVESLLHAHEAPDSFLRDPVGRAVGDEPIAERAGTLIWPYKLLEQIGEGGFGVVFMAEQIEPIRRKVALKVLKPGMDTRQVVARFEAERQALALMDHPNIAKVHDGGVTSSNRPYLVMELVKGVPITEFCDQHHLTPRQRLELFVPVCQAVHHAHQKGIIHRDLKPSNILVVMYDTTPVVKVIDFGIAKALGQELTDRTLFTGFAEMIGTPLYMSPEQAGQSGLDIDIRSDIYSLGVLAYEMLTATTPFDKERFKSVGYDEMRRIIREEDPPRPSTRLAQTTETLRSISTNRRMEPAKLTKVLRGELDWIVMKCLEKDRNRRYESASVLAADVERYLLDEPVLACPPSAWYLFRKFVRRNKTAAAAVLVVVLAVIGLVTSTLLIAREQLATATALQAETHAREDLRRDFYFHRIALAHRELSVNNLKRALQLLDECPGDLREWEWHYLMRLCRVEPVILRDKTEVNSLAFSPDGLLLASGGGDGAIKIWNVKTGRVIQTIEKAHGGFVCSVAFHSRGKHLATVGADRQVKVWEWATAQEVFARPCDGVYPYMQSAAFSPLDGRLLAAGCDGELTVWDWKSGGALHTFTGHDKQRLSVAFSRDGRRLASGSWAGSAKLWDAEAWGEPLRIFPETTHPIGALSFDKDGGRLATASFNRCVDVLDTTTGRLVHRLSHTDGLVLGVAFSPDGRRLASTGEDKTVHIWDPTSAREVLSLRGHTGWCGCVAFSPDGLRLASASQDKTIYVWDATPLEGSEGQEIQTLQNGNEVWSLAVSPDGQKLAAAGWRMPVTVRDPQTEQKGVEFPGHSTIVFDMAWKPDGRQIAAAGGHAGRFSVKVWDAQTQRELFTFPDPPGGTEIFAVEFSPDGQYLVTGNKDGAAQVWDARNGRAFGTLGTHDREIRGVVFCRDGSRVASVSGDGRVKVWPWDPTRLGQAQKPTFECQARSPGVYGNVAFSPDGGRLVTGGDGNTVKVWDARTGQELATLRGHTGDVCSVAFSPDGRWLATAGEDTAVRIWEARSWKLRHTLRGHTGLVSSLVFIPKSHRLVSGSRDHTIKFWDVTPWEELLGD